MVKNVSEPEVMSSNVPTVDIQRFLYSIVKPAHNHTLEEENSFVCKKNSIMLQINFLKRKEIYIYHVGIITIIRW